MNERQRPTIAQLEDIVRAGLCSGYGLCQSVAGAERVELGLTPAGRLRPWTRLPLDEVTINEIAAVCPGTEIHGLPEALYAAAPFVDNTWGPYFAIQRAGVSAPDLQGRGLLDALAIQLLESGQVDFILQATSNPGSPLGFRPQLSFDRADVLGSAGTPYGQVALLSEFRQLLARGQRFAFIGRPCDLTAIRNLAWHDPRVDELCCVKLSYFCLGLTDHGEIASGAELNQANPDEAQLQFRCQLCPDAASECADLAVFDIPGEARQSGVITRTEAGAALLAAAQAAGLVAGEAFIAPRELDDFQPYQVYRKQRVWARIHGLRRAGSLWPNRSRLRVKLLALQNPAGVNEAEMAAIGRQAAGGIEPGPLAG
ncbi:MAG: Coenzyme F420 hydrogenase/dehydrogenase, beta subunit C-terminal domain [Anaerolineales bacterium]|nr:Coenzyme F420 hydrogenase/dehydrogenase, beta subunit C-terminal domain [Anaerolineales bacterium]